MFIDDPFFSSAHVEMIGTILVPLALFYFDQRNQAKKHHAEWMEQQASQHKENTIRLTKLETVLEPIADWWNEARSRERNGGSSA